MPTVLTGDAELHVEVDGEGPPVTVLAHGLTNNCRELAAFTPFVAGTKVRFCFRGHGHSGAPPTGYRFADLARDVEAVARAYGATCAVGTSMGAGAISNLLCREPDRFERLVFLLPAGLDLPFPHKDRFLETAARIEGKRPDELLEAVVSDPERLARYLDTPWRRAVDEALWEHVHPEGLARAIREVIEDVPVPDRELLRRVTAPTLVICIEGDPIHPAELGRILAELMPEAELLVYANESALLAEVPALVQRVSGFLAEAA